jgi:hypothetical protein
MDIITKIEYLIEQVDKQPSQGKLLTQNLVAGIAPIYLTSKYISPLIQQGLIEKGVSNVERFGNPGLSNTMLGTSFATGLIGSAGAAAAGSLVKKYQEKKYGIKVEDNRTKMQKLTDTGIKTARIATGTASRVVAGAALGPLSLGASLPATIIAGTIANHIMQKPLNTIQQKIQQKRMLQQQAIH